MGRFTRRWQDDENVVDYAAEVVQGTSDEDMAAALTAALLAESAGGDR